MKKIYKTNSKNFQIFLCWILLFVIQWFGWQIIARWDFFVNDFYPSFYKNFYPIYSQFLGWIPFSVGDLIYVLIGIFILIQIIKIFKNLKKKNYQNVWKNLSKVFVICNLLIFVFHAFWAMNYHRDSIFKTQKIKPNQYTTEQLKFLSNKYLNESIKLRKNLKEDEKGVFEFDKNKFLQSLPNQLNEDFLIYKKVTKNSQKKPSLFSWFLRYAGITGYYNPFSGEAQFTAKIPDTSVPFTLLHEQAHQMGYAPEYEASFVGFLTGINSTDEAIKYSTNYKAVMYVLSETFPRDSVFVRLKLEEFSDEMKRDRQAEIEFQKYYSGQLETLFSFMNNVYLQSNNQQEGVESYNRFVDLLVWYEFKKSSNSFE